MNRTSTSTENAASVPPKRPLRIVVVDDNRDTVITMAALLRVEGHDTRACHHGKDVLRCVTEFDADVVLLDVAMPGMSGWDVARELRQVCGEKRPMIIGVTGEYTKGADRVLAEMAGFDYYLIKPADPKVLFALLEKAQQPG